MWNIKHILVKITVIVLLFIYCFNSVSAFLSIDVPNNIAAEEKDVSRRMSMGEKIEWIKGVPDDYIYYYLMGQKGIHVY